MSAEAVHLCDPPQSPLFGRDPALGLALVPATAAFDRCELRTLVRDVPFRPYGFVFAPSTAAANPHGYPATGCRITSESPDGAYGLARPWRPSGDLTAVPMLTCVRPGSAPGSTSPRRT
ncbi:hypothetical protein [Streptosporangium sp. NPDC001681]|uniref:hypothetical protein n=1 Tax=Streptosporangium sp. NPDC001681 TaxID=3154395 RepID=UPI0033328EBA